MGWYSDFDVGAGGPEDRHTIRRCFTLRCITHFSSPVTIHVKLIFIPKKHENTYLHLPVSLIFISWSTNYPYFCWNPAVFLVFSGEIRRFPMILTWLDYSWFLWLHREWRASFWSWQLLSPSLNFLSDRQHIFVITNMSPYSR